MKKLVHFLFLALFFSCSDEEITTDDCIPQTVVHDATGLSQTFELEYPYHSNFIVNPNNHNEVAFKRKLNQFDTADFIKYNLITKESETVRKNLISYRVRWSKTGYFVYTHYEPGIGGNIFRIDDTTFEQDRLTSNNMMGVPTVSQDGREILSSINYSSPFQALRMTIDGIVTDTIIGWSNYGNWDNRDWISIASYRGLYIRTTEDVYDTEPIALVLQKDCDGCGTSYGSTWVDEERIFWCQGQGIYITDITTGITEEVRATCNSRSYQLPTYIEALDKVYLERIERYTFQGKYSEHRLVPVMMNPDGSGEEIIDIYQ